MNRRTFLTASAVALGVTAGCSDAVVPDEIDEEAEPAAIQEAALTETDFVHESTERRNVEDTITVQDNAVDYSVLNWVSSYRRSPDPEAEVPPGQMAILSTPEISVLSRQVNPVGQAEKQELIERLGDEAGITSGEVEQTDETTRSVLDQSTTFTIYETTAEIEGTEFPARGTVGRTKHGGDWLVIGGSYPAEESHSLVGALVDGIDHPVDPP